MKRLSLKELEMALSFIRESSNDGVSGIALIKFIAWELPWLHVVKRAYALLRGTHFSEVRRTLAIQSGGGFPESARQVREL